MVVLAASSISETKRVRYLLGLSFPAEREEIESEFFADEDAFQRMLTTEDDLIDAYARGELAGDERRRFEKIFMNSLRGRNRVQFARAFADAVAIRHPVESKDQRALLDVFKFFQLPRLLPTTTIAALIVLVALIAWLIIDRTRMNNRLRKLHAESAALSKQTEALQGSSNSERTRNGKRTALLPDQEAQPDKPRRRGRRRTTTQQARYLPEVKGDHETIARIKPEASELLENRYDATFGNIFANRNITELPLETRNVVNLLTLQPGATRGADAAKNRADQANLTLQGVELVPRSTDSSGETTIRIPNSSLWIRFQIPLETAASHEDYLLIIKTAEGRSVTSVNWSEPLTPNQTRIVTPVISTSELPSGNYVLLLMGQEPKGSFVKVTEYSFKVIKY